MSDDKRDRPSDPIAPGRRDRDDDTPFPFRDTERPTTRIESEEVPERDPDIVVKQDEGEKEES